MKQKQFQHFRRLALAVSVATVLAAGAASGEDLLQIYREAQKSDPQLASARAGWEATQERVPQARAGLLPSVSATGAANVNNYDFSANTNPSTDFNRNFEIYLKRFHDICLQSPERVSRRTNERIISAGYAKGHHHLRTGGRMRRRSARIFA